MKQLLNDIEFATSGLRLIEITDQIVSFCNHSNIKNGILNLTVMHTSASLIIQENASSEVLHDLLKFYDQLAPMNKNLYAHSAEGRDDMPAHIKSSLTNTNLTLSIQESTLALGTWQGIFLFEHRINPHKRTILAHILGD